eukprot:gene57508-biopygen77571
MRNRTEHPTTRQNRQRWQKLQNRQNRTEPCGTMRNRTEPYENHTAPYRTARNWQKWQKLQNRQNRTEPIAPVMRRFAQAAVVAAYVARLARLRPYHRDRDHAADGAIHVLQAAALLARGDHLPALRVVDCGGAFVYYPFIIIR